MRKTIETGKLCGYEMVFVEGEWLFSDTMKKVADTHEERPCGICGKERTPEGHDGCVGTLPGVMNACCGHGNLGEAYVQFPNGRLMQGQEALDYIKKHRRKLRRFIKPPKQ